MKAISPTRLFLAAVLASVMILPAVARAGTGVTDSLKCFSAKDLRNIPSFPTVTLVPGTLPFPVEEGCQIRNGASEYCTRVTQSPSGPPSGVDLTFDYLCYPVVCEKNGFNATVPMQDQFGTGSVKVSKKVVKKLCTPTISGTPG